MTTHVRERRSQAIRKAARNFKTGEVLYLYGCDTGDLYGVLRGAFWIAEIKYQSDTGVSFFLHQVFPREPKANTRTYLVEFARDQVLTRLSGPTPSYLIEEAP